MATTEHQLSIWGCCQGLPTHATAWHPRATQQSLHPDPVRRTTGEARPSEILARACSWPAFCLGGEVTWGAGYLKLTPAHSPLSYLGLPTVGSLLKLK